MGSCPAFPTGKVREIIEQTADTGKEHAFVRCADGTTTDVVEGQESQLDITGAVESCDLDEGPVDIIHTHPNGVDRLSKEDMKVAASDDVESVCVAVEDGKVRCEMVDSCEMEVDA